MYLTTPSPLPSTRKSFVATTSKDLSKESFGEDWILDRARKEYHRDIVVIKDHLSQQKKIAISLEHSLKQRSEIRHTPPAEVIDEVLQFSPGDCVLKMKPCSRCDGHEEVIDRESVRFLSLIKSHDKLTNQVKDLRHQLLQSQRETEINSKLVSDREERARTDHEKLTVDRDFWKEKASSQDDLKVEHRILKDNVRILNDLRVEKEEGDSALSEIKTLLSVERKESKQLKKKIAETSSESKILRIDLKNSLKKEEHFQNKIIALDGERLIAEDRLNTIRKTLNEQHNALIQSKEERQRINSLYDKGKDSIIALQKEHIKVADADKCTIATLDDQILKLNTMVKTQQNEIEFKRKEAEHFRLKIERTLQKYDEINRIKKSRDISLMEKDKSLEVMANLSSSHIQGLYDYTMALEKILENGGKDNVKPALKYTENNKNLSYILNKLEKRLDSTDINWKNLLEDEGDRRHIFGNLNNRLHLNLFKLKKHIENLHRKHRLERNKILHESARKISEINVCNERTFSKQKSENILNLEKLRNLSTDYEKREQYLHRIKDDLQQNIEGKKKRDYDIEVLRSVIAQGEEIRKISVKDLDATENKLHESQEVVQQQLKNIKSKDKALDQMEIIFQKTMSHYTQTLEKEQKRMETNRSIALQVSAPVLDFTAQCDFVLSTTLHQQALSQPPNNKRSSRAQRMNPKYDCSVSQSNT